MASAKRAATGIEAEKVVVGRQGTNADAELIPPFRHVIQVGHSMGQFDRLVEGKQVRQRAESDPLGSLQRLSNQQVGSRTRFPVRGEVLPDPGLLETERIEPLQFGKVPALTLPDAPLGRMGGHQEGSEFELLFHLVRLVAASIAILWRVPDRRGVGAFLTDKFRLLGNFGTKANLVVEHPAWSRDFQNPDVVKR